MTILIALLATGMAACATPSALTNSHAHSIRDAHEKLDGVLWMQTSAEYHSLVHMIYSQARMAFDNALLDPRSTAALEQDGEYASLPPAIIVDIDETVLDNSRFEGRLAIDRTTYKEDLWRQWVEQRAASAVPGAVDFLNYVATKGVTIFYVTNRDISQERATRDNLEALHFPLRSDLDIILSKNENGWSTSDKGTRRAHLSKDFRILLLVGDDLGDFVSGIKDTPANRVRLADSHKNMWGTRWILLPNPLYGSWERAIFNHDVNKADNEILQIKLKTVQGF